MGALEDLPLYNHNDIWPRTWESLRVSVLYRKKMINYIATIKSSGTIYNNNNIAFFPKQVGVG